MVGGTRRRKLPLGQAFCFTTVQANGVNEFTDNWVFSGFLEFFIKVLEFFPFFPEFFNKLSDFSLNLWILYFETMLKFRILLRNCDFLTSIYRKTRFSRFAWVFWRNPWVFGQNFPWVFSISPWVFFFAEWKKKPGFHTLLNNPPPPLGREFIFDFLSMFFTI